MSVLNGNINDMNTNSGKQNNVSTSEFEALKQSNESSFAEIKSMLKAIVQGLDEKFDSRFAEQDKKLDEKFDSRFAKQDSKFDAKLEVIRNEMNGKFDRQFIYFENRFDNVDENFEKARLERINLAGAITTLHGGVEQNSSEIAALGNKVDRLHPVSNE